MIDLWGVDHDHIKYSIELLKEHEPPEGYYLAFSGGKDSIVCYHLCKQAEVKFDAHYRRAMEPLPKKTMWQLIRDNGIPPLRTLKYCCHFLKETGGKGRLIITGVRKAESVARRNRQELGIVHHKKMLLPILNWSTDQVWEYIRNNSISYPDLYDKGFKRIGCILCPCGGVNQMKRDANLYPKIAEAYKRACIRAWDKKINPDWESGEAMFEWWLSGKSMGKDDGQGELEW